VVDDILSSLDETDGALDRLWAREAEDRLSAWRRGEIRDAPLKDVLRHFQHVSIRLLEVAQRELREAVDWYAAQAPRFGDAFLIETLRAFD